MVRWGSAGVFEVELLDLVVEEFNLDVASFESDGEAGRIGQLSVQNQAGLSFRPGRDGLGISIILWSMSLVR